MCRCGCQGHGEVEELELSPEIFDYESAGNDANNRRGSQYVRWVQTSLNKILGLNLKPDGSNGPQTRSAVRSFQLKKGLQADGIVGNATEAAMINAGAGQPP